MTYSYISSSKEGKSNTFTKAIIYAFGIIVAFEIFVGLVFKKDDSFNESLEYRKLNRLPTVDESIVHWQINNIENIKEKKDVLLLGDSSCLVGLDPVLMEDNTDLSIWNAGTLAWLGSEGHADVLELYIKNNGAPKILVYHLSLSTLGITNPEIKQKGFLKKLKITLGKKSESFSLLNYLPSYRYKSAVRNFILRIKKSNFLSENRGLWPSDLDLGKTLKKNKGHLVEPTPGTFKNLKDKYNWDVSKEILNGMSRIVEISNYHKIKLLLTFNPLPESIFDRTESSDLVRIEKTIRNRFINAGSMFYRASMFVAYADKYCSSVSHLIEKGTRLNTMEVLKDIRKIFEEIE